MDNTPDPLTVLAQASAREHASRAHADLVRPPFELLNQLDPATDAADAIRKLLHLAEQDSHIGSERPELLAADGWLMYATSEEPDPGAGRIGHDDDSRAAGALLLSFCGGTLPENPEDQVKLTSRLIAGLLRATIIDGYATETNDLSDLLANTMAAARTLLTPCAEPQPHRQGPARPPTGQPTDRKDRNGMSVTLNPPATTEDAKEEATR